MQPRAQSFALVLLLAAGCSKTTSPEWPALAPYLAMQDTLADDSIEGLKAHRAALEAALPKTPGFGSPENIVEGMTLLSSDDVRSARRGFERVSAGMIEYLKDHPEARPGLMVVHCTMAFQNAGASWVQRVGIVENPYEGKNMLHCGDKVPWQDL